MASSPRFRNRQNARIELPEGRVLFESRSVAITAIVVAHDASSNSFHALVGKRGPAVDQGGLWCLVGGYLDWDESLADAVRREVFEEAAVDLAALEAAGETQVSSQPMFLQSDPSAHRQNVTGRFLVTLPRKVPASNANAEPGEVEAIEWLPVERDAIAKRAWAFHHDAILLELADWYAAEAQRGALDAKSTERFRQDYVARLAGK